MEYINTIIEPLLVPITLAGCYALGAALKSTKKFPDNLIPLTLFVVGGTINPLISGAFTAENIVIGAVTGWASVGLNQTLKQLGRPEE